jgi:hypothetical protein
MADENILKASKELYAATITANVPRQDRQKLDSFAGLINKNRQLLSLPEADARAEFLKLDEDLQKTLKQFNPKAAFTQEEDLSFIGQVKEKVVEPVLRNLSVYSSRLTEPYRAIRTSMVEDIPLAEAWKKAYDSNALFDKQRETKVDAYYDAPVAKIAKQIATGKTIGEVLSTLETPEDIAAMQKMLMGGTEGEVFARAIKDYDTAKISIGRDAFYELFSVDPGDFGANRFAFNRLSGAADLAASIAFDPLTYIPIAGQAYKASQLSILKIAEATGDVASLRINKAFDPNTLLGRGVNNFFDEIGQDIKKISEASNAKDKAQILASVRNKFKGDIDDVGIQQLVDNKVYDAQAAKVFIEDIDNAVGMLNGRWAGSKPVLPTYGVIKQFKNNIKASVAGMTGLSKIKVVDDIDLNKTDILPFLDTQVDLLRSGNVEEITKMKDVINKSQTTFGKFARLFEIAPSLKNLKTGIKTLSDGREIDEGLKSTKDVVALARTAGFAKPIADEIGARWINANQAQRIKIRDGLVATMAHSMGLSLTDSGRAVLNRTINVLKNETYATPQKATKAYVDSFGSYSSALKEIGGDGLEIDPSKFGGSNPKAVALYQLSDELSIPPIHEWYREAYRTKNWFIKSMGPLFNNKVSQGLVDAWSFLTLVPRLGIRSAIEEAMMFGFVAPYTAIKSLFSDGFKASRALRRITNINKKGGYLDAGQLSLPMRGWYNYTQKGINEELRIAASKAKNGKELAPLMAIAMQASTKPLRGLSQKKNTKYAEDFFNYSYGSKAFEDISVSGSQGVRLEMLAEKGMGSPEAVSRIYGDVAEFSTNLADALKGKQATGPFDVIPIHSPSFYINWQVEAIKGIELNGQLGKIAVENLDKPDVAIKLMKEYLEDNPDILKRFVNAYEGEALSPLQLAVSIFAKSSEIYRNADGAISKKLLDLVRRKEVAEDGTIKTVLNADIDMDALKAFNKEDLPATVLGRQFVPVANNQGGFIKAIQEKGYAWMDRQIATLTREPFFYANWQNYRKQLTGVENKKVQQLVEKGYSQEVAEKIAAEYASNAANDLAVRRTLEFVDNPNVRTNMAWSLRNFARFWRATEDFYRRAYRTAIKNPQSLIKLRLSSDGLDHAGFIHNDENGDKYFIFPGDEILTAAIAPVTKILTGKTLQTPMPLQFTGKIKMITPSLDPQSSIPTLSGPLSGFSMYALYRMMPNFMAPVKDRLLGTALGPRSQNARWTDVLIPSNIRRAVDALNQDERESQFASAARKAIVYMAATNQSLPLDATEAQKLDYRQKIEGIAANIVVTRFFLGLISPVAPQIGFGQDIPEYLKDAGNVNFKAEFNKLVNEIAMTGEPDAYNLALEKWTKINPGLLAYTIGETDTNKIAVIKKTNSAAKWVRENRDLIAKYPEGSGFFIPYVGEFNFDDYTFLKREGYTEAIPIDDFLKKVSVAEDKRSYYELKKSFDERLDQTYSPSLKAAIRDEWAFTKEDFLSDKPLLIQELETRQSKQQIVNAVTDLRSMVDSGDAPKTELTRKYKQMLDAYDKADLMLNMLTSDTKVQRNQKEVIRQNAYRKIQEIAQGDPQAEMAVRVLFAELLGV